MLKHINIVLGLKKGSLGQGIVKSRGGFISKIHAATDENGKAMCVFTTCGNIWQHTSWKVTAWYDSWKSVILPRKNRKEQREYNKDIYKNRNQIERFFNRLKQFRRIATRYDKLLFSFLSLVQLAVVLITIPKFPLIV